MTDHQYRKPIITIDGPAGSGKSTTAELLARRLGFTYLDTGAYYRAVTLQVLESQTSLDDYDGVLAQAARCRIEISSAPEGDRVILNGIPTVTCGALDNEKQLMNQNELRRVESLVRTWVATLNYRTRIHIFGSRLKGTENHQSDLDLAIELIDVTESWRLWFDVHTAWENRLTELLGYDVHLELHEGDETSHLAKYLKDKSVVLHESPQ